jgi:hypothetical protein
VNRPAAPQLIVWLGAGFVVWSSALITLYMLHAIGCAFAWPAAPLRLGLATVIVVHLAALAAIWRRLAVRAVAVTNGGTLGFMVTLSLWATIAATAATVLVFGPTLLLTTCV